MIGLPRFWMLTLAALAAALVLVLSGCTFAPSYQPSIVVQFTQVGQQPPDDMEVTPTPTLTESMKLPVRIDIEDVVRVEGGVKVTGQLVNISGESLMVPISALELIDTAGSSYIAGGGASTELKPGESTPIELTTPLTEERHLVSLRTHLGGWPMVVTRIPNEEAPR